MPWMPLPENGGNPHDGQSLFVGFDSRQVLSFTFFFLYQEIVEISGITEQLTVADFKDAGAD